MFWVSDSGLIKATLRLWSDDRMRYENILQIKNPLASGGILINERMKFFWCRFLKELKTGLAGWLELFAS